MEIIAQLSAGTSGSDWDDFIIDASGTAYIAQPENALARITPDGVYSVVAGGSDTLDIIGPTSVELAPGGKVAYVTTRGGEMGGYTYGGQLIGQMLY